MVFIYVIIFILKGLAYLQIYLFNSGPVFKATITLHQGTDII